MLALDESHIDRKGRDGLEDLLRVPDAQLDLAGGMGGLPAGDQVRQQVFADGVARSQPQRRKVRCREQRFRFSRLFHDACRASEQGAPVLVEHQALADAVEKLDP